MRRFFSFLVFLQVILISSAHAESWTKSELALIKQYAFKNIPQLSNDPSNKYLYNPLAIKLGKSLFNEPDLSSNQKVSCGTCHLKNKAFTDNKTVALGMRSGLRNTPTLLNAAEQNWFFWDGSTDSLWAQALSSIENPAEQGFTRVQLFRFISTDSYYRTQYENIFEQPLPTKNDLSAYPEKAGPNGSLKELIAWKKLSKDQKKRVNRVFTNIGKSIASYVSTLKNKPNRFDRYIDDLQANGQSELLNESEKNGLRLFISQKSGCLNCHSGALFTNKAFHNIGTGLRAIDNGRSEVIDAVIRDEFNCLGAYSDANPEQCLELKYTNKDKHVLTGAYKTPSLRNLSKTPPYMHDGRFNTLSEVLTYYASINENRAVETDLPAINLSEKEQADIVSFLLTL